MVQNGPANATEEKFNRNIQIIYNEQMRERQVYMQELGEHRKLREKQVLNIITKSVGPTWYHALSIPQRKALDALEFSIYQDLLEGRPVRTSKIIRDLGLFPRPNHLDLMNCLYLGRDDPKVMLSHLFNITYGHSIDAKRSSYSLNAKLMLSGILYLGLQNLIVLLKETFRPDKDDKEKAVKPKPKLERALASPYLQDMIAVLYEPPRKKLQPPPPLPNLDELDEPYEEEPPAPKPSPPPPPPPPPKKRLPQSYCDKLADIRSVEPPPVTTIMMKTATKTNQQRRRGSKLCVTEVKKTYGLSFEKNGIIRRKKPKAPTTGLWNAQYMINGVFQVAGRTVFVLGNVSMLPPIGDLINGGYMYFHGQYINIHCGFCARPPPPKPDPCDCLKLWQDKVLDFVKRSKCYCEHYYDYGNDGALKPDELPLFQKPTKYASFSFNYENIFQLEPKQLHVAKEFKRVWDKESLLQQVDVDGTVKDKKDIKRKKKKSSKTCLGENPKPEDYLKCALRLKKHLNVAARLPDIHLVPELKEWMRKRLYGPFSVAQKKEMIRKSTSYWQFFLTLASRNIGHLAPPQDPSYTGHTSWKHKQELNEKFKKYTAKYKLSLYRSLAKVNNILWPTMFQSQFPDKKFREIYFSYLFGRLEDMHLMHPYSSRETTERKLILAKNRYVCLPPGIE